ncbi:MAG: NAD(+)/NADH kinase [Anaerolineales bacterium]|jgi:NAD+ kinase
MTLDAFIPQRVAIASHPTVEAAGELADEISAYLAARDVTTTSAGLYDEEMRNVVLKGGVDLLVAVGGDGTMLRASHLCAAPHVPILGIKLGHLGFLTEAPHDDWKPAVDRVLAGEYRLEERMMLRASHVRAGETQGSWELLNEAFIGRGEMTRPVILNTEIDGHHLTTYVADGVIIATPTGSTAYALAAGGPILPPELRNVLIVPVAPHLSVDRAVVLSEGSWVRVEIHMDHQGALSIDGQAPIPLQDGDQVEVCASEHSIYFVRFEDADYFYRNLTMHMNRNPSAGAA